MLLDAVPSNGSVAMPLPHFRSHPAPNGLSLCPSHTYDEPEPQGHQQNEHRACFQGAHNNLIQRPEKSRGFRARTFGLAVPYAGPMAVVQPQTSPVAPWPDHRPLQWPHGGAQARDLSKWPRGRDRATDLSSGPQWLWSGHRPFQWPCGCAQATDLFSGPVVVLRPQNSPVALWPSPHWSCPRQNQGRNQP